MRSICGTMKCEPVKLLPLFTVLLICHVGYSQTQNQTAELPPTEFPKDNTTYKIIPGNDTLLRKSSDLEAPHVFPSPNSNYTIIQNRSLLEKLSNHSKVASEALDLNKPVEHEASTTTIVPSTSTSTSTSSSATSTATIEVTSSQRPTTVDDPDLDSELIESDPMKTEDVRLQEIAHDLTSVHLEHAHLSRGSPAVHGQLAAILAGVFAMIAVCCYIGLLTWRKFLEHRYGNREMLINEEEYINYNDMKNFEL